MVVKENAELESYFLSSKSDVCVPIELKVYDDSYQVIAYSGIYEKALLIDKFSFNVLSKKSISYINDIVSEYAKCNGFVFDKSLKNVAINYKLSQKIKGATNNVICFSCYDEIKKYDCSIFKGLDISNDNFPMFGVVKDNTIVSFAAKNEYCDYNNCEEIFTKTLTKYRNNGFATQCVKAISNYYVDKKISVLFVCKENNKHSIKIAEKLGFSKNYIDRCFVCYR